LKWVRDFETLSKRKKVVVGIASAAIGSLLVVLGDLSLGISLQTSVRNLMIALAASLACVLVWSIIVRFRRRKAP
jgi:hypothetical protein